MKTIQHHFERRERESYAEGAEKSFVNFLFSASSANPLRPLRSKIDFKALPES
jgi:hypothetical protein